MGVRANFGAGGEDAVTEKGGRVFVPQATEAFAYDLDGNLTNDGRKLEFVLDQIVRWGHTFEATDVEGGPKWVGGERFAYINCQSATIDEAAEWGLDALREWAAAGVSDGGYLNAITRQWAISGDGSNYAPASLGSTLDWLYLFSRNALKFAWFEDELTVSLPTDPPIHRSTETVSQPNFITMNSNGLRLGIKLIRWSIRTGSVNLSTLGNQKSA